jgi:hypothetical protein
VPGQYKRGSFWWRNNLKLLNCFKGIAQAKVGPGDSISFWQDMWNGKVLKLTYPQLFSFTFMEQISLSSVLHQENFHDIFQLPLSEEAYDQYCELDLILQLIQVTSDNDQWKYIWGNGHFSVKMSYNHLIGSSLVHPAFRWLWGSSYQPKHKVFY